MSPKNLNVQSKTHRYLLDRLKDKRISQIYKKYEDTLKIKQNFLVAVSGGADSLALCFLSKIYSIKNSLRVKFFIVDHKLRPNSTLEAKLVKQLLNSHFIKLNILKWNGKKPTSNIQSCARNKRYKLLVHEAKKSKIKNILTGHHVDDLYENFFIRMLRGSGLNGLVSFDLNSEYKKINLIRPLINFEKKDLVYISNKIFNNFFEDPSNVNEEFTRIRVRKLIKNLHAEGFDKKKFFLTIKNLKFSNDTIKFYIRKNLLENTSYFKNKSSIILTKEFFNQPHEIVFRSFREIIKIVGKKYYTVRGKKLDYVIESINSDNKSIFKFTLGNCIIKKINNSILVTKEQ